MGLFGKKKDDEESGPSDEELAQKVLDKEEEDRKKREQAASFEEQSAKFNAHPTDEVAKKPTSFEDSMSAWNKSAGDTLESTKLQPGAIAAKEYLDKKKEEPTTDMSKWQDDATKQIDSMQMPRTQAAAQKPNSGHPGGSYYDVVRKGLNELIKGGAEPRPENDWMDAKGQNSELPYRSYGGAAKLKRQGAEEQATGEMMSPAAKLERQKTEDADLARRVLEQEDPKTPPPKPTPEEKKLLDQMTPIASGGHFSIPNEVAKLMTGATNAESGKALAGNNSIDDLTSAPGVYSSGKTKASSKSAPATESKSEAMTAEPTRGVGYAADDQAASNAWEDKYNADKRARMDLGARPSTPTPGTDWGDVASNIYQTGKGINNDILGFSGGAAVGALPSAIAHPSEDGLRNDAGYLLGEAKRAAFPSQPGVPIPGAQPDAMPAQAQAQPQGEGFKPYGMPNVNTPDVPQVPVTDPEMARNVDLMKQAIGHSGEIEQAKFAAQSKMEEGVEQQRALNERSLQGRLEYTQAGEKKAQSDITEAQKVLNDPVKTPNPERYWANHSKIMFAIGVGLLAQAGKDINGVLQSVNSAIDRDIEQQKQEFEAPRNAAKAKKEGAQTLYAQFRDQGHDAFEASRMAEIVLKDQAATATAKIAANAGSADAQYKAQELQAGLGAKAAEANQARAQHTNAGLTAAYTAKENAEEARIKNQISLDALNQKGRAAAGAGAGKGLSDADAKKLADSVAGLQELTDAGKIFKSGLGSAVYNKLTSLDPTATTDAARFNAMRPMYKRILASLMSPAERQNETMMKDVMGMVPNAGDADAKPRWDGVLNFVRERTGAEAGAMSNTGSKTAQVNRITGGGKGGQIRTGPDGRRYYVEN